MTDKEFLLHAGQTLNITEGYQAVVKLVKIKTTPHEVCKELMYLDLDTARVGDLKDIQRKAKVAYYEHMGLDLKNESGTGCAKSATTDSQGPGGNQGGASDVES